MGRLIAFPAQVATQPDFSPSPVVATYTAPDAARLARIPAHRLYEWRREQIIFPTITVIRREANKEDELYSFESLVYLRLLRMLRQDARVSLRKSVGALVHLRERFGQPGPGWADARIFLQGPDIFVEGRDEWEVTVATRKGQQASTLLFGPVFAELRDRADALLVPTRYQRYVEIDPEARSGMPIVRGTTLRTSTVYSVYQRVGTYSKLREHYPLSVNELRAAVNFERLLDVGV